MTPTVAGLMAALDALSAATTDNNREAYLEALAEATRQDASTEQIRDAHWYGSQRRMRRSDLYPSYPTFDWLGEER